MWARSSPEAGEPNGWGTARGEAVRLLVRDRLSPARMSHRRIPRHRLISVRSLKRRAGSRFCRIVPCRTSDIINSMFDLSMYSF